MKARCELHESETLDIRRRRPRARRSLAAVDPRGSCMRVC